MSKVLLTGASGFIALHILDVLLDRDYTVVATIRSEKKLPLLKRVADGKKGSLIVEYVADNNEPHGYDKVFQGHPDIKVVVHTASPAVFEIKDAKTEAIDPAINGTVNVLKAAKEHGPAVDQIVLTSSVVSVFDVLSYDTNHVFTEKDWSKVTIEQAVENPNPLGYFASKKYAEIAAWDFLKEEKPTFTMTSILPPFVFGPMLGNVSSPEDINESNASLYNILKGNTPQTSRGAFVHVKDVAEIHANAIGNPAAVNKRWLAVAGGYVGYDFVKLVADSGNEQFKAGLAVQPDETNVEEVRKALPKFDSSVSLSEHKQVFRSLKESVLDTVQSFVDSGLW